MTRSRVQWLLALLIALLASLSCSSPATALSVSQVTSASKVGTSTHDAATHGARDDSASRMRRGPPMQAVGAACVDSDSASAVGVAANAGAPVGRRVVTKTFTDEAGSVTSQARYGWEMKVAPGTNSPAVISGQSYSGHALDQMQGRGIVPSAIEDAIGYGASAPSRGGTTVFYSSANDLSVVVNSEGRVVTASFGDLR